MANGNMLATILRSMRSPVIATVAASALTLLAPVWESQQAWSQVPQFDRVRVLATPRPVDDAQLTDQYGEPFNLSSLRGRVTLVLFGFTNCPDACPTAMQRMREVLHSGELDFTDVAYVLVSVDGERDTPQQMREFLAKYSPDFIGLTGDPEYVRKIATQFKARFFKGHADHGGHYDVAHSPQIFVLDRELRLRAELYDPPVETIVGVADALIDEGI